MFENRTGFTRKHRRKTIRLCKEMQLMFLTFKIMFYSIPFCINFIFHEESLLFQRTNVISYGLHVSYKLRRVERFETARF